MTLQTHGADKLGTAIANSCAVARALADRIDAEPALERLAPVALNIVCFRFKAAPGDLDRLNADIVTELQEAGIAAPSTTTLGGRLAIRAALVNHRVRREDADALVEAVLAAGWRLARAYAKSQG
jgi:aromatic-L-amino-acid/L-tryptophan decarboxylase